MNTIEQLKSGTQVPPYIVPFLEGVRKLGIYTVFKSNFVKDEDGDEVPNDFAILSCFTFESAAMNQRNPLAEMFGDSSPIPNPPAGFLIVPALRCNGETKHMHGTLVMDLFAFNHYLEGFKNRFKALQGDWEASFNALEGYN
jgi:hypothetical protein